MPTLPPDVLQLLTLLAGAGAIYGGVRADLKSIMSRLSKAEEGIDAGRVRMDNHIERSSKP